MDRNAHNDGDKTPQPPPQKRARHWSPVARVPPAPPTTPAPTERPLLSHPSPAVMQSIQNAAALEQAHRVQESATPIPTPKPRSKSKTGPGVKQHDDSDEFSEWAVGDRYELIRMLGRGSYGEVAQARDLATSETVAIKRITSAFDQEVDAIRLYREMHILRRLRGHDCIIQLLDVVQPPSPEDFHDLYFVFECKLHTTLTREFAHLSHSDRPSLR